MSHGCGAVLGKPCRGCNGWNHKSLGSATAGFGGCRGGRGEDDKELVVYRDLVGAAFRKPTRYLDVSSSFRLTFSLGLHR